MLGTRSSGGWKLGLRSPGPAGAAAAAASSVMDTCLTASAFFSQHSGRCVGQSHSLARPGE